LELEDWKKDDWYISKKQKCGTRLFKRSQILTLVFIMKDNIRNEYSME